MGSNHGREIECSGKGTCERKTGKCSCFEGYEGEACQRTSCPNQCSNHGRCLPLKQIAEDIKDDNTNFYGDFMNDVQYETTFDATQSQGCVCDPGWFGADCSLQRCPSFSDPMGGNGGMETGRPCSGRGSCDTSTGTCTCFKGYFGTACEIERNHFA